MSPIEEELRAAFERHETLAPPIGPVRAKIDMAWARARRRRLVRRVTGAAAGLLMAGAGVPVVVEQWQHQVAPAPAVIGSLADEPAPTGPLDVLLLGSDNRLRLHDAKNRRADTVMMIHVPADRSRIYLVSLPRDGEVKLPGGARAKLSETLYFGGPALTGQVVSKLTGVDFDATVTIDFRALRAVTAAVGGVEICLPLSIKSAHNGKKYPKGCQHLGADDVGPVLQARYGFMVGSYERDRNSQRFLRALFAKLTADGTTADPGRLHELLVAAKDGLEIDGDAGALLGAVPKTAAQVVGIGAYSFAALGSGREQIYPKVGPKLYQAIRDDTLDEWVSANPTLITK
ncbi:LCP family protein [Actinoplanes friuliensis]|uniref:Cell envelope-related transcriptional attenuator n=1 Tax=Actinoplanes friuliensis DSM 7358 TaxID=1246995 RepID=U5VN61_9ACTN|nr:LCP family protein [Actinoplanes friuliensis]AGZ38413.1 cell envelope-related transcriptional attenuator [Actinoplanes friuliensis DSM 7358]